MALSRGARVAKSFVNFASKTCLPAVSRCTSRVNILNVTVKRPLSSLITRPVVSTHLNSRLNARHFADDHGHDENIEDATMNVLKLFDKVDQTKVSLDAHFINDLGLDSLDVVEVVMAFEDEFGIEISDEEAEKILTVQQAVDLIKSKLH